jgi:hypothetical protein
VLTLAQTLVKNVARRVHIVPVLFAMVAMLTATSPTHAQGTSGQLPDPISTPDLKRLMSLYVQPSDAEMATIEALHDDYRAQFRLFRESDIEKFMTEMNALMGTGVPSKAQVQDFTRKYEQVNSRIAEIDGGFFDAIGTLLGEGKQSAIKRAKDARSRQRLAMGFLGQLPGLMGGGIPDVSEMALQSKLPVEVVSELTPELISYEEKLTSHARDMSTAGMRMMIEMVESLEKAGFGNVTEEEMMADPARMEGMMSAVQTAMAEAMKPILTKVTSITQLNAGTFKTVHGRLSGDDARKFRLKYVQTAYPEVQGDPANAERLIKLALRIRSLDENSRASIKAAYESWKTADDALVDESIKIADTNRKELNVFDFERMGAAQQKLIEVMTKRTELGTKTLESIKPLVGDERLKKLYERAAADQGDMFADTSDPEAPDPNGAPPTVAVRAGAAEGLEAPAPTNAADKRMSLTTLRTLLAELGADEGAKAAIESLFSDYEKKWEAEVDSIGTKLSEAQMGIWVHDSESRKSSIDGAKQETYFKLRKEAISKATQLDDALFGDMAGLVGEGKDDVLAAARLARTLEALGNTGGNGMYGMWGESEKVVNVIEVVRATDMPTELRSRLMSQLAGASGDIARGLRESRLREVDIERELQLMSIRNQEVFASGEQVDQAESIKIGEEWMKIQAKQAEVVRQRTEILRAAWEAAMGSADDPVRDRLQLAYDRAAHPDIFDDARSATPLLEKALEMPDLSDDQRRELQILNDRYRDEYTTYCRQMVPKRAAQPSSSDSAANREYWRERMAQENLRARIRFDRDERSQRAVSQLRRILTADQAGRIGALASYDEQFKDAGHGMMIQD